jgi:putative ABC transport system permease protein
MGAFLNELGQAWRALRRDPGFGIIAIAVFAIGMGATTAIFTLVQRVVLDPLAYPEADRLLRIRNPVPAVGEGTEWHLSIAQLEYYRDNARTLDAIGVFSGGGSNAQTPDGAERVDIAQVQANLLPLLGARPALGRLIGDADDDPGAANVVMLSHGFWQRSFGGSPEVLGRTLLLNDRPYEVIGVLAAGLRLPDERGAGMTAPPDVWLPYVIRPDYWPYSHTLSTIARLAPGATLEQAQAEIERLASTIGEAYPEYYTPAFFDETGMRTRLYALKGYVVGSAARNLWVLLGGVSLVLLIACMNVANLFLVRLEGRRREIAVRAALGAGRLALARQFFAESAVISIAGGVLAIALGWWGVDSLVLLAPDSVPRLAELRLGMGPVALTLALALVFAIVLAAFPILQHRRAGEAGLLVDSGRTATVGRDRQRMRGALVAAQVALALVLLVSAGLLLNSFQHLRNVDPGVDAEGVLTTRLHLPDTRYETTADQWRFFDAVIERIERIPGVRRAGLSRELPFSGGYGCTAQGFDDAAVMQRIRDQGGTTCAGQEPTSPGYFEAIGIPLLEGRTFTNADNDAPNRASVIVSRAFAERFWPGERAIGKNIAPNGWTDQPFYHVVGVVDDVYSSLLEESPALAVYYPIVHIPSENRRPWGAHVMSLVVRTSLADPASIFPAVRAAVAEVDPSIPLANAEPMTMIVARSMARLTFTMSLLVLASVVALVLAAVGLYGVIAYIVTRRTRELGVRLALGALPRQLAALFVRGSIRMVGLGMLAGTAAALALTRVMRGILFDVPATDPTTYVISIAVLATVSLLASWLPARRAARVDPMIAMRVE